MTVTREPPACGPSAGLTPVTAGAHAGMPAARVASNSSLALAATLHVAETYPVGPPMRTPMLALGNV